MPIPVIAPPTSILAPFTGENLIYQPAATNSPASWKEAAPLFAFTNVAATNVLTVASLVLKDGMRVRLANYGFATATITSNGTNVTTGDTVTIGSKTYTFRTALTPTEGEILIGANADASLLNLIRAINHTGTPDTDYKCAAVHPEVSAATSVTASAFAVTALLLGQAYVTTDAAVTLSWGAAAMTGGIGVLPAPLQTNRYYYLRDVSGATCKLVDSLNGLAIHSVLTVTGGVAATNVITTATNHGLVVGDRINFPTLTGGSGITAASVFYYVETAPSLSTFTISATLGGTQLDFTTAITDGTVQRTDVIDLTDTGSGGTHYLQLSALPDGLALDAVLGTIFGSPKAPGFYEVSIIANNASGDSAAFIFPIGVRAGDSLLEAAIALEWDWDTGLINLTGGKASTDPKAPLFAIKNGDIIIFAVQFMKAGKAFAPQVQYITAGIRPEDEELPLLLSNGNVSAKGEGSNAWFYFVADTNVIPSGGAAIINSLSDFSVDGPDIAPTWLELRLGYNADPFDSGAQSLFYRASRSIPINIERSLIAA